MGIKHTAIERLDAGPVAGVVDEDHEGNGEAAEGVEVGDLGGRWKICSNFHFALVHKNNDSADQSVFQLIAGMMRFMNSSNSGTVKAVSPKMGLQIIPLRIRD